MGATGEAQRSGFAGERRSSVMSEFSPFGAEMRDMELATTRSRIKARRRPRRLLPVTTARSAGSFKSFRGRWKWGQNQRANSVLRSLSPNAYSHKKKIGVRPQKGDHDEQKREIPPLPVAGEKGHSGVPVTGEWEPEHYRLLAGGRAGHGGLYPRRRMPVQRRGSAPAVGGERSKCAKNQWLYLVGAACARGLGGGR